MQKSVAALQTLEQDLQKTNEAARAQFAAGTASSKANVHRVLSSTLISALIVTLALIAISWLMVRAVWRRLGGEPEYAHEIASAIAGGDLSMEIAVEEGDSSSLLAAMRQMKQTLEKMIADIKASGATINTASAEIAAGNADLSARTESQASSLEEVASAMEQMTSTVKTNMENALNANRMSADAAHVAERGGEAVEKTIRTMAEINDSAQRIADIIGVIDGIAFQTNILALNAAVEAARAGEQGRGFAVVATEVRSLAQRSASAAKEIKELINDSVSRVEAGSTIANQAGATMSEVVAAISSVAEIVNGITTASQEQTSGIEEIGRAIVQMDETTQQNAAMVEEASAAATALKNQAALLARSLSVFRLSSIGGAPASGTADNAQPQLGYRRSEQAGQRLLRRAS
jgi:methyl-accepting chemotaxis protein